MMLLNDVLQESFSINLKRGVLTTPPDVTILNNYTVNDLDLQSNGQYYGLATRLIYWTLSPLVDLYFSTEGKLDVMSSNAAVYMIWGGARKLDACKSQNLVERILTGLEVYKKAYDLIFNLQIIISQRTMKSVQI